MCVGLANGYKEKVNVRPDNMEWNTGLEAYIEKKKVKFSATIEDYNINRFKWKSKNRNRSE